MQCHMPLKSPMLRCPLSLALQEDCCTPSGLLNEYLNISEHPAPEAGGWLGGQESPSLLKNFQLFHQVSKDSQHLFDFISGGLRGL